MLLKACCCVDVLMQRTLTCLTAHSCAHDTSMPVSMLMQAHAPYQPLAILLLYYVL